MVTAQAAAMEYKQVPQRDPHLDPPLDPAEQDEALHRLYGAFTGSCWCLERVRRDKRSLKFVRKAGDSHTLL